MSIDGVSIDRPFAGLPPKLRLPPGAVDTQAHIFAPGYPPAPGAMPLPEDPPGVEDYRSVMRWLGLSRVVVTQSNAHQKDNANLLAVTGALRQIDPDMARAVAVIDGATSEAELARLHDAGVRGARIMALGGGAVGLDQLAEVDARTVELGWTLAVQFDGGEILEREAALTAIRSNWILDHHGKFFGGATPDDDRAAAVRRLLDTGRCWYKIAAAYESSVSGPPDYADVAAMTAMAADHAPERIVWGTNWPHNLIVRSEDYPDDARLLDLTLGWIPQEILQATLVDNPAYLFDFPAPA